MANPVEFKYAPMFQLGEDKTEYRLLSKEGVTTAEFEGKEIVKVSKEALTLLAQQAFHDVEFMLRREHNEQVAKILKDDEASENDKYVALQFLRNAEVAAKGILPFCQDTGTAIIHGEKGQQVWTGFEDEEALSRGVYNTFTQDNLRYSQNAPLNMYDEVNTRCNLPAQIDIEACEGAEYKFVMVAKGGGSANKTYFYPMTKATIQNEGTLLPFLVEKMKSLGTAACPPYHIAFVIGGTSAEKNLLTVKLASIKYYDGLPTTGDETGRAFRDVDLEQKLIKEAQKIGLGAQFGGKYLAHDIRVVRLPRHGASCPIGMGVSCSADRNIKAKINADGIWLEKMDSNPTELIPEELRKPGEGGKGIEIDLNEGIDAVRKELSKYPVSTRVNLRGTIIVARDIDLENKLLEEAHKIGLGAQFGGKALAHDIRVVRLPRHGASCPIGMGVSCSADRNIKAKINRDGIWLEKMDANPTELIPEELRRPGEGGKGIEIDLSEGIDAVRKELSKYPVSTRVNLKGTIIVARDIAHAKLKARLDAGEGLPEYFKKYPVLYAGPAKTPEGYPCGSMGPTTANRMDPYVDEFQENGGSLVMIAKGNRSDVVTEACKKHGGFYLGTIGGVAAVLSQSSIKSIECVEYPELGMEAVWKIEVEDFPAFILVDDKGNDFFKQLKPWCPNK